jgi:hypothetical protein
LFFYLYKQQQAKPDTEVKEEAGEKKKPEETEEQIQEKTAVAVAKVPIKPDGNVATAAAAALASAAVKAKVGSHTFVMNWTGIIHLVHASIRASVKCHSEHSFEFFLSSLVSAFSSC